MLSLKAFIKGLLTQNENDRTKELLLEASDSATTSTRTTVSSSQTANRTINLPDADDTLMGRATTDTVSNKDLDNSNSATFQDNSLTIQDDADNTKQAQFDASTISTSTTRTISLPDGDTTLLGDDTTQVIENKTIDGTAATGNNTVSADAGNITYDNAASGLTATDVQAATDEVEARVDTVETDKLDGPGTHGDNLLLKTDGVDTNDLQTSGIAVDDSNNITGVNGITTTGDVTVGGNLQVDGTTTSVNSATLEVEDANVTVNKNGNQAAADSQGAGLTVEMSDATDAVLAYDSTLTTKFKIGETGSEVEVMDVSSAQTGENKTFDANNNTFSNFEHGAEVDDPSSGVHGVTGDVVGTTDAQVLTEKDIDGGTASNTSRLTIPQADKSTLDGLTRKEGTLVYANDLDTFFGDNGTDLFEIGSGIGEKNYFDDGNFENNIDLATTYDDGGSYADGTGGSPSVITVAQNGTTPLADDSDLAITKAVGDATGEGVSLLSRTIDRADLGRPLFFSLEVDATDANYTSGDVQLKAYDVTNASIINIFALANLDDNGGVFSGKSRIQAIIYPETTTEEVRVSLHTETDSTTGSSWTINVDDAKLLPDSPLPAAIITETEDIGVTITNLPTSSLISKGRRVGSNLELYVIATASGAATGTISLSLDTLTIDSAAVGGDAIVGTAGALDTTGGSNYYVGAANFVAGVDNIQFYGDGNFVWGTALPYTWASGDLLRIHISVPIEEWKSGNLQSTIETGFQSLFVKANLNANQTGITNVATKVEFDNVLDSNGFASTFDTSNNRFIAPKKGRYYVSAIMAPLNIGTSDRVNVAFYVNGSFSEGVNFGSSENAGNSGGAISTVLNLDTDDYVEVFVDSFTDNSWDVLSLSTFTIMAQPDFTYFGTYGTYEVISANSAEFDIDASGISSGDYPAYTGNSVTLTPGTWKLYGMWEANDAGSPNPEFNQIDTIWSTENGANNSSQPTPATLDHDLHSLGGSRVRFNLGEENLDSSTVGPVIITVTESTEIFLNTRVFFSVVGDSGIAVGIIAERLR